MAGLQGLNYSSLDQDFIFSQWENNFALVGATKARKSGLVMLIDWLTISEQLHKSLHPRVGVASEGCLGKPRVNLS
jgi:hypothetical protein